MSSPAEFYMSLPPISKAYATICFITTLAFQLGLLNVYWIVLDYDKVFRQFQVWRLLTNFFFLGPFSIPFGIRLLMIARYAVQLEKGPFERRMADFLWMVIFSMLVLVGVGALIPAVRSPVMAPSLVSLFLYLWSREFPTAQMNIMGLFTLKGFYLPWAMLGLNVIFGSPFLPDMMGILAGHLYYYLSVLYPRGGGRNFLKTPLWVHKLVASLPATAPQVYAASAPQERNQGRAFTGRSYRLQ